MQLLKRAALFLCFLAISQLCSSQNNSIFHPFDILPASEKIAAAQTDVENYQEIKVDKDWLNTVITSRPGAFALAMPRFNDKEVIIDFEASNLVADNFTITTASGVKATMPNGRFYRGKVRGSKNSFAAISVFSDNVYLTYSYGAGNICLSGFKAGAEKKQHFILYEKSKIKFSKGFSCATSDSIASRVTNSIAGAPTGNACVKLFFDCDYGLYSQYGYGVTDYVFSVFNEVNALYNSFGINLTIASFHIWDTPDNFQSGSSYLALSSFEQYYHGNFNGDIAILLAQDGGNGGVAGNIGVLCDPYNNYTYCDFNFGGTIVNCINIQSELMAHEIGHDLGSRHTHWCGWVGGPIDDCNTFSGCAIGGYPNEGNCSNGPTPPPNGGTIMSYCHCVNWIGIDWSNGFGPQPQRAITNYVSNAVCLSCSKGYGDDCSNAIELTSNTVCKPYMATLDGTTGSGLAVPACGGAVQNPQDKWFSFTAASGNETVTIDPERDERGADYLDAVVVLYASCDASSLVQCYHNAAGGGGVTALHTFTGLITGSRYYIRVFNLGGGVPKKPGFTICVVNSPCALPDAPVVSPGGSLAVCGGQPITLTITNPCAGCSYSWSDGAKGTSHDVATAGVFYAAATNSCATSAYSNVVTVLNSTVTPAPIITPADNQPICKGQYDTLTVYNTCKGCTYTWSDGGTGTSRVFNTTGSYYALANSSCGVSARSNTVTIYQATQVTPQVYVTASATSVCQGKPVYFSASALYGGSSPVYEWFLNGKNTGITGNTYTYPGSNSGDSVYCLLTSNQTCVTSPVAISRSYTIQVAPLSIATLSIKASSLTACLAQPITFTASTNIRSGSFEWFANNTLYNTGIDSTYTFFNLQAGDYVQCVALTGANGCFTTSSVASNSIYPTIKQYVTPSVSIASNDADNIICKYQPVVFTAFDIYGGPAPTYKWFKNGNTAGTGPQYTTTDLADGDAITCQLTTSELCSTVPVALSDKITVTVPQVNPVISKSGYNLTSLPKRDNATWVWYYNNNIIDNAFGNTITAANFGSYKVVETFNTCSAESNVITINAFAPQEELVRTFPNPFSQYIFAQTKQPSVTIKGIRLFAEDGRQVLNGEYNNLNVVQLYTGNLSSGNYIIEFITNAGSESHKLIKQ